MRLNGDDKNLKNLAEKYEEVIRHVRFVESTLTLLRDLARTGDIEEMEAARPLKLDATARLERIGELSDQMIDLLLKVDLE